MSKEYKLEDCFEKFVKYTSSTTGSETWNGMIRCITPDEDNSIEINGCRHDISTLVIKEVMNIDG
jgi:hypothetical protein